MDAAFRKQPHGIPINTHGLLTLLVARIYCTPSVCHLKVQNYLRDVGG